MRLTATRVVGAHVVVADRHEDERGTFSRTFDAAAFAASGLPVHYPQHSLSTNRMAGTLRGLHLQLAPFEEAKLVRCVRGAMFDVVADTRPGSVTFGRWAAVELSEGDGRAMFVPAGCAHGFQTLQDDTHVLYLIDQVHQPSAAAGYRWDDPTLGVEWPRPISMMSERDRALPLLVP